MKTISVLGANGQTGQHVVRQLQERGDKVIAIFRNEDDEERIRSTGADVVTVDFSRASVDDMVLAILGSDAVVYTAGGDINAVDRDGSVKAVDAAQIAGIRRFVQVSVADRPKQLRSPDWDEFYNAKRAADRNLRASNLDWTILEPGRLDNNHATGRVELGEPSNSSIARADVAAAVLASLDDDRTIGHAWELTGGETRIRDAIDHLV